MSRIWLIDTRHQRDLTRLLAKKSLKGLNQKLWHPGKLGRNGATTPYLSAYGSGRG